jgi:exodeoxyribonuclease VII small subunit
MSDTTPQPLAFEDALKELEQVVRCLEDGNTGLEEALGHYEKGVGLLTQCYGQLRQAEQRIQLLTGETADGQPVTALFEHAATLELQPAGAARRPRKQD